MGWVLPRESHDLNSPTIAAKVGVTSLAYITQLTGAQKELSFPDILVLFQHEQRSFSMRDVMHQNQAITGYKTILLEKCAVCV